MVLGRLDDGSSFPREMFATSAIYLSSPAPGQGHGNLLRLSWGKAGECFPRGSQLPEQGRTNRAVHWQRGSEQQTPALLTHLWKPTEQQGVISQESGPLGICHLLFD